MRPVPITLFLIAIATIAATAVGCGGTDKAGAGDGSSTTPPPTTGPIGIDHPSGPTDVVLRVTVGGGFVQPSYTLRSVPQYTLYGDGTVITPGAVPAIYPGPAVAPLTATRLDKDHVPALLRAARDGGLLGAGTIDYGDMGTIGVADAPTTTVLIAADGHTSSRSAYALSEATAGGSGLSATQSAARAALSAFVASLAAPDGATPYVPAALAVYVGQYQGVASAAGAPLVWPLASNLATAGTKLASGLDYRCIPVTGADVASLLPVLRGATEESQWVAAASSNATFGLVVRALLPDEQPCVEPEG